jgi:chemotaxis protein CheX
MVEYIQPFIDGCKEVFRDLCKTEIDANRAFFVAVDEFKTEWDISGIIGLSGEVNGAVALSLKEVTAYKVTKILTGNDYTSIDKEVTDVVGEIVNIIVGNVKNIFEEKHRISMTMPSIVKGNSHSVVWPTESTRIMCIPFSLFENETISLFVAVKQSK